MGSLLLRVPGFYLGRLVLFVFLSFLGGAGPIYDNYLEPFLDQNHEKIDQGIAMIWDIGSSFFKKIGISIKDLAMQQFREFITLSLNKNKTNTDENQNN